MAIRIMIGGLNKESIAQAAQAAGGDHVAVTVTSDFEAGKKIKAGEADYYFGACNTGGGAALAVLIAVLGYGKCATVAKAGKRPNADEIGKAVEEGKVAFGMAVEAIGETVPMLVGSLLKKHQLG
jgi:hypothetical protein